MAGILNSNKKYDFEFPVEKPYETYSGLNVRLRYFIRVTISRNNFSSNYVKERDIAVHNLTSAAQQDIASQAPATPLKMEVGIEDCLHIEFEYDKQKYHLKDVILGKIYFLLVRIKIKHMELAVIRKEAAGTGPSTYNESENIIKYELMDGAPVKGECVPIRLFLSPLELTPTYRSVNNVFSVKYYLNLVLIDEEDRRYFKQQEVIFWRRAGDRIDEEINSGIRSL
jgi:vacuolar protein sorting-associated protein 26